MRAATALDPSTKLCTENSPQPSPGANATPDVRYFQTPALTDSRSCGLPNLRKVGTLLCSSRAQARREHVARIPTAKSDRAGDRLSRPGRKFGSSGLTDFRSSAFPKFGSRRAAPRPRQPKHQRVRTHHAFHRRSKLVVRTLQTSAVADFGTYRVRSIRCSGVYGAEHTGGPAPGYRLSSGSSDLRDFGPYRLRRSGFDLGKDRASPHTAPLPQARAEDGRAYHGRGDRAGDPPLVAPDGSSGLTDFGPYRLRCSVTAPTFRSSGSGRPSPAGLASSVHLGAAARRSATPEPARGGGLAAKANHTFGTSELTDFRSSECLAAPIHHESGKVRHRNFRTSDVRNSRTSEQRGPAVPRTATNG